MEKVFKNKKLAYVLIGILCALQLTQSIANWVGGGFNGGSLILCILMLVLLVLVGVGIEKKNKLLTIVSGVSILSVVIYAVSTDVSGIIKRAIDGNVPVAGTVASAFTSIGALLLIGCLILIILRTFKINKNLSVINTVFSVIAAIAFFVPVITMFCGMLYNSQYTASYKTFSVARDFFVAFIALLVPCVWYQVDAKE